MPVATSQQDFCCTRTLACIACLIVSTHACMAATCVVNSSLDDPSDASSKVTSLSQGGWSGSQKNVVTLRDCILESNLMTGSEGVPTTPALTIDLSNIGGDVITLQDNLPMLFNNVTITTSSGYPVTIDGNFLHRIFFVSGLPLFKSSNVPDPDGSQATSVIFSNLILARGLARGGDGGGGGLGAGGALFVNKNASVTLNNVVLEQNIAFGGDALQLGSNFILSGGGMGAGVTTGARGGGGLGGPGTVASGAGIGTSGNLQKAGGFGGTGIGQLSLKQGFSPGDFDVDTGSGTLGSLIGGGGLASSGSAAHPGGFGGGGGNDSYSGISGNGGFGGGGAWTDDVGTTGGNGGFGGGGGGGLFFTLSGDGGFGAGAGTSGDFSTLGVSGTGGGLPHLTDGGGAGGRGGGGAGFGGAVFVRAGATLQITSSIVQIGATDNMVIPGSEGDAEATGFTTGASAGSAIFAMSGAHVLIDVAKTYTIDDDVADDSLTSLPAGKSYQAGNGGGVVITKLGVGALVMNGIDTRGGTMVVQTGTLAGNGILSGPVRLVSGANIQPGDPSVNDGIGALATGSLLWYAGGSMSYQLGATDAGSDHLAIDGVLLKQGAGNFIFHFGCGASPPTVGQTYRLITATSPSNFTAQDFSFDIDSSLQGLSGKFSVDAFGVSFSVNAVLP